MGGGLVLGDAPVRPCDDGAGPGSFEDMGIVAAGVLGGAIIGGAIASSRPAYGGPVYVEEAPYPACRMVRERFWDGYDWRYRRVEVCN